MKYVKIYILESEEKEPAEHAGKFVLLPLVTYAGKSSFTVIIKVLKHFN